MLPTAYRPYDIEEYNSFRASVPQKKVWVDGDDGPYWRCFDTGPRSVSCPLVMLPPVCGGADCFYKQMSALAASGYRVVTLQWPPYWSLHDFTLALYRVLDALSLIRVHFFGASLGGYLAQKFAETDFGRLKVASLILCNSFTNTRIFRRNEASYLFWALPGVLLKRMLLNGLPRNRVEKEIADSVDFMVNSMDNMSQSELASRMTLNCARSFCEVEKLAAIPKTIIDVFDSCALSRSAREDVRRSYANAKMAHLKDGGNFPFLSRSDQVNLFLKIHLRPFDETSSSAKEVSLSEDVATMM